MPENTDSGASIKILAMPLTSGPILGKLPKLLELKFSLL